MNEHTNIGNKSIVGL